MPSPSYVDGATGLQKGIDQDETGIKIESIEWSISDEKQYSFDKYGGHDGFCHGYNPSVSISVSGEISGSTGVAAAAYGTAVTFANEEGAIVGSTFAGVANTGGFYPEDISFSESRDGFRTMSITAISHPDIT